MAKIAPDDPHYNIPRDAKGDPIFFILEALIWSHLHRQPNPLWLTEAAVTVVLDRRTKTQANRVRERRVQWVRFTTVRDAKEQGLRWLQTRIEVAAKSIADLSKKAGNEERIEAWKD